jgi:hypothetical protein
MSVASVDPGDLSGGHVKIGAAHHYGRNAGIIVGALLLGALAVWLTIHDSREDAATLTQLEAFRSLYADKCEAAGFQGEASSVVKDAYLRSAVLREALAKQQTALQAGAPCEEVARALKAADYPLPVPTP